MSATTGYTLLSASDGPLSSNMSYDEFQMRLVHGLLLEPGFVMIDAYFIASGHLRHHILNSTPGSISLFGTAMRRGLIVPARNFASELLMTHIVQRYHDLEVMVLGEVRS